MVKFSVIIPCYQMQDFVGKAIKSVQDQSYSNYEILVICQKGDDPVINTVREYGIEPYICEYKTLGAARNIGISIAKGEYILFLDCDDWYLHNECFAMLDQFTHLSVEVMTFAFIFGKYGYTSARGNNGAMYPNVWSRVWRKSFLDKNNIRFPDSSKEEDVPFTQKAFECNPHHTITDIPFIYYNYPREGSIMNKIEKERDERDGNKEQEEQA